MKKEINTNTYCSTGMLKILNVFKYTTENIVNQSKLIL